jgi:hypothetical protein
MWICRTRIRIQLTLELFAFSDPNNYTALNIYRFKTDVFLIQHLDELEP